MSGDRPLDVLRVGGAKQQSLAVLFGWHPGRRNQAAHVRLKAHIQHPVSLIKNQIAQLGQPDLKPKIQSIAHIHKSYLKAHRLFSFFFFFSAQLNCIVMSVHDGPGVKS